MCKGPEAGLCLGTDKTQRSGRSNRERERGGHDPFFCGYGLDCQNDPRVPVTHRSLVGIWLNYAQEAVGYQRKGSLTAQQSQVKLYRGGDIWAGPCGISSSKQRRKDILGCGHSIRKGTMVGNVGCKCPMMRWEGSQEPDYAGPGKNCSQIADRAANWHMLFGRQFGNVYQRHKCMLL